MDEASKQLQTANDMLNAMRNQREQAQNECVQLAAQIHALTRENTTLKADLDTAQKELAALKGTESEGEASVAPRLSNGLNGLANAPA